MLTPAARARLRLQPGHRSTGATARDGSLACMVAELNNTFGERLPEVLRGPELHYEHDKRLHVSPFFGLDQSYEYAFSQPGDEVWARIHVRDDDGARPLTAVLHGRRRELTNASLARSLAPLPADAAAGDRADPLAGAAALAEARAVPPQAAVRAGRGDRCARERRAHEPVAGPRPLARARCGARCSSARSPGSRAGRSRSTLPGRRRAALRRGRAGAARDPRPRASSAGSRRAASSASASRTPPASGTPTTSSALFELLLRNAEAAVARHARVRRLLELRPRLNRRNGLLARAAQHRLPLRPRQRALRADARRDDDVLVRRLRAAGHDARRRAAREATSGSATSCELGPDDHVLEIGCGWGGFARHAAERLRLPRHRPDDLARAGGARARARRAGLAGRDPRAGLPRASRARYTKVVSIEMLEAIGERPVRHVLRDDRPRARAAAAAPRPDDPHPRRSAGTATAARPTGSSATSSPAA